MQTIQHTIGKTTCFLHIKGSGGPVIYWPTFLHRGNEIDHLLEEIEALVPEKEFVLAAFLAEDWNRDYSPWPAPPAFGSDGFGGWGQKTLSFLVDEFMPWVQQEALEAEGVKTNGLCYLIGYSLAGLFSLWAAYETDLFDGIACCSGSLWYNDWDSYVEGHQIRRPSNLYLSLGGKEEKTKNQQLTLIGARTREQEKILKKDPKVKRTTLEWNGGGHFADSGKRLAKGVRWLLEAEE